MEIKNAKYIISNAKASQCPDTDVPEYAFIGRSNVGKSSLINMITNNGSLAKTSQKPGKTLLINHFSINNGNWHIVDLPGYGYAARGMAQRKEFSNMITDYVLSRRQMACLFVLIDVRHKPQKIDLEFLDFCGENGVPIAIVFTKADKVSKKIADENIEAFQQALLQNWECLPPMFTTSSAKKTGRDNLLEFIAQTNKEWHKTKLDEEEYPTSESDEPQSAEMPQSQDSE